MIRLLQLRPAHRVRRAHTILVAAVSVLAVGTIAIVPSGAYLTDGAVTASNSVAAGTLPAVTSLTAVKAGATLGQSSTVSWSDAKSLPWGAGSSGTPNYTLQRSSVNDFSDASNPSTVYSGPNRTATDIGGTPAQYTGAATQVASTTLHDGSFALIAGKVYLWGSVTRPNGVLWVGTGSGVLKEVTGFPGEVKQLAAGRDHACALMVTGSIYCVGWNDSGQLGVGSTVASTVAVPITDTAGVLAGKTVTQIDAGAYYTCALAADGTVACWGDNAFLQLGAPGFVGASSPVPVRVANADGSDHTAFATNKPIALTAGDYGACVIKGASAGTAAANPVACWGRNNSGQLGENQAANVTSASPVDIKDTGGVFSSGVAKISAGDGATCVLTNQTSATNVACWAGGEVGVLGNGVASQTAIPTRITSSTTGFTTLDVGNTAACAGKGATLVCWGDQGSGQLGNGQRVNALSVPVAVTDTNNVFGGSAIISIGLGWTHSCAVSANGALGCWGNGAQFQLGQGTLATDGTTANTWSSVPVAVELAGVPMTGIPDVTRQTAGLALGNPEAGDGEVVPASVSVGGATVCERGWANAYCWGANNVAQTGKTSTGGTPVLSPRITPFPAPVDAFSMSPTFGCAREGARVYCWGSNGNGQLGDGTTIARTTPTLISIPYAIAGFGMVSGIDASSLATSSKTSCASDQFYGGAGTGTDGYVVCWGSNSHLQLGVHGPTSPLYSTVPVQVTGGALTGGRAIQVAVTDETACALTYARVISCWGGNVGGQLGINSSNESLRQSTPTAVTATAYAGKTIAKIVGTGADGFAFCALTTDGQLYCWGEGVQAPVRRWSALPNITDIAMGMGYICAIAAGTVYCHLNTVAPNPTAADLLTDQIGGLSGKTITSVDVGGASSACAVAEGDGVYCWGSNASGQLGNGTTTAPPAAPLKNDYAICPWSSRIGSTTTCTLVPSTQYYYKLNYGITGTTNWVSAPKIAARP